VARFFRAAEIPAIICGGAGASEGLPICAYDGTAALRHAIGVFSRAGHTKIVAASRYHRPLRERVFREEFGKRGLPFDLRQHMPLWSDPEQLHNLLCTRLREPDPPTAWIINGMEGLIVFFSTMLELGLRIPDDVSLLTFGSDPMLGCFRPAVSHYATPHRTLAVAVARMIRSQFESQSSAPVSKLIQTVYVPGGSVGPAR
jgi:LacI family transcriptional regulator